MYFTPCEKCPSDVYVRYTYLTMDEQCSLHWKLVKYFEFKKQHAIEIILQNKVLDYKIVYKRKYFKPEKRDLP